MIYLIFSIFVKKSHDEVILNILMIMRVFDVAPGIFIWLFSSSVKVC